MRSGDWSPAMVPTGSTWTCSPQRRPTCHVNGSSASSGSTPPARPPPSLPLPARTCPWRYVVVVGESARHRGRPQRAIRLPGPTYDRSTAATLDLATGPCSTDANERDTVQSLLAHAASITTGTPVRQRGGTVARPTPPREGVTSGGEVCRVWFLKWSAFRHPGSSGRRGDGERPGRARHRGRSRRRRCHRTGQPVRQSPGVSHRRRHRRWTHRRNRR